MEAKKGVNEDKVKQALLIATNKKLKDVKDDKLKELMKDKLNPQEIAEVIKRKNNIPSELLNSVSKAGATASSEGESRMGRVIRQVQFQSSTLVTGFNIASLAVLSSIGTSYLVQMTRQRKAVIEQQVHNGKIEEQVNSFNGRLRQLESDIALLPARYVGKEELNERLSELKEEAKDSTPQKKKLRLGMRAQTTLRGKSSETMPLQMVESSGSVMEMARSTGNIEGLKEEVKAIGDNLSKIAEELGKVREKEEGGRQAIHHTLNQLIEVQKAQNLQLQSMIQKVGESRKYDQADKFNYQESQTLGGIERAKNSGEIELYEVADVEERQEEKEPQKLEEGENSEGKTESTQHRKDEDELSNFEKFIGKFEDEEVRTQAIKVLSSPLRMVSMSKEQAGKARINPNNSNFKIIFANPGADEFLTSLGFKKSYSSIYEFQSQNWEEEVSKIKGVLGEITKYLKMK